MLRFLADMGVSLRVVEWLRREGHDTVHLRDEALQRLPNGDTFAKADAERRVILTFDLDFGELVALAKGRPVSVVVFRLRDTRTETVIQRLGVVLRESADSLSRGAIIVVEDGRHRVRKLAIGSE